MLQELLVDPAFPVHNAETVPNAPDSDPLTVEFPFEVFQDAGQVFHHPMRKFIGVAFRRDFIVNRFRPDDDFCIHKLLDVAGFA